MNTMDNITLPRFFRTFLLLAAAVALTAGTLQAQPGLEQPRTSQGASVTQRVGITDITVTYHRPGVKGREIWGGLVPYGEVWRAGANEVTTISFSDDVTVEGQPLAAGKYGLHIIPQVGSWTVIFSNNSGSWGTTYDEKDDTLRVDVTPLAADFTEWMMFDFADLSDTGATLELRWVKLRAPVKIGVPTPEIVLDRARKAFAESPDTTNWLMLREAAAYALSKGLYPDEARSWIDRSIAAHPDFRSSCVKSEILSAAGDRDGAARLLNDAIAGAAEKDVTSYSRILLRENRSDRAIKIVEKFVTMRGAPWGAVKALGDAHAAAGDRDAALRVYRAAMDKAPESDKEGIQKIMDALKEGK
jgi:hypothetical protein